MFRAVYCECTAIIHCPFPPPSPSDLLQLQQLVLTRNIEKLLTYPMPTSTAMWTFHVATLQWWPTYTHWGLRLPGVCLLPLQCHCSVYCVT